MTPKKAVNRQKLILDYGSINAFAITHGLNPQTVVDFINKDTQISYFKAGSMRKKAFDKLNELGYIKKSVATRGIRRHGFKQRR